MSAGFSEEIWRTSCQELASSSSKCCGLSYEVFVRRFSTDINLALLAVETEHRELAIKIAREFGYSTNEEIAESDVFFHENGYCQHGIDPDCCPAGCGDLI